MIDFVVTKNANVCQTIEDEKKKSTSQFPYSGAKIRDLLWGMINIEIRKFVQEVPDDT